jgi:hypothetical protein
VLQPTAAWRWSDSHEEGVAVERLAPARPLLPPGEVPTTPPRAKAFDPFRKAVLPAGRALAN